MNFKICQVDCVNGAAAVICICLGYSHISYGMGVVWEAHGNWDCIVQCKMAIRKTAAVARKAKPALSPRPGIGCLAMLRVSSKGYGAVVQVCVFGVQGR